MHTLTLALFSTLLFSLLTLMNGLSVDLIHRDSPLSPLFNPSLTPKDLTRNAMLRTLARHRRFHQTNIVAAESGGEYLMRFYIGTPPVETWATADTGSDLIWVQCLPCHTCYPQNAPFFDPKRSSTYRNVPCHSKPCTRFFPKGFTHCGISKRCEYFYSYQGNTTTMGELARDHISFGKSASFRKSSLLFGCGHNNTDTPGSGLVGLGNGPLSLVSQLGHEIGHKFSYCLVPYFSNSTSKLKLGEEAKISASHGVVSTPLITNSGQPYYFLILEGITVGEKTMKLKTEPSHGTGNEILLDSGTTLFYIESSFYTMIEALVKEAIGIEEAKNPPDPFQLCYSNKYAERIKKKFPDFVVHFKGADVFLKPDDNVFFPLEDMLCFAVLPSSDGSFTFGNVPQINFQVLYDLEAKKVSFAPVKCSKH